MLNILCNVTLNKQNKKEIQQMITAGFTVGQIVDKLGVSIIL